MVEKQNVHQNANGSAKNHTPDAAPKAIGGENPVPALFQGRYRLGADILRDLKQSLAREGTPFDPQNPACTALSAVLTHFERTDLQ